MFITTRYMYLYIKKIIIINILKLHSMEMKNLTSCKKPGRTNSQSVGREAKYYRLKVQIPAGIYYCFNFLKASIHYSSKLKV